MIFPFLAPPPLHPPPPPPPQKAQPWWQPIAGSLRAALPLSEPETGGSHAGHALPARTPPELGKPVAGFTQAPILGQALARVRAWSSGGTGQAGGAHGGEYAGRSEGLKTPETPFTMQLGKDCALDWVREKGAAVGGAAQDVMARLRVGLGLGSRLGGDETRGSPEQPEPPEECHEMEAPESGAWLGGWAHDKGAVISGAAHDAMARLRAGLGLGSELDGDEAGVSQQEPVGQPNRSPVAAEAVSPDGYHQTEAPRISAWHGGWVRDKAAAVGGAARDVVAQLRARLGLWSGRGADDADADLQQPGEQQHDSPASEEPESPGECHPTEAPQRLRNLGSGADRMLAPGGPETPPRPTSEGLMPSMPTPAAETVPSSPDNAPHAPGAQTPGDTSEEVVSARSDSASAPDAPAFTPAPHVDDRSHPAQALSVTLSALTDRATRAWRAALAWLREAVFGPKGLANELRRGARAAQGLWARLSRNVQETCVHVMRAGRAWGAGLPAGVMSLGLGLAAGTAVVLAAATMALRRIDAGSGGPAVAGAQGNGDAVGELCRTTERRRDSLCLASSLPAGKPHAQTKTREMIWRMCSLL